MSSRILKNYAATIARSTVEFDPRIREHAAAYAMMAQQSSERRQHPNLRFIVEEPFTDLFSMMQAKMAQAFIERQYGGTTGLLASAPSVDQDVISPLAVRRQA